MFGTKKSFEEPECPNGKTNPFKKEYHKDDGKYLDDGSNGRSLGMSHEPPLPGIQRLFAERIPSMSRLI